MDLGVVSLSSVPSSPYSNGSQFSLTEEEAGGNHSWQPIATPPSISTTTVAITTATTISETQETKLELVPGRISLCGVN